MSSIIDFIVAHSDWYSASYFILVLTFVISFIGWFFSMDFYDVWYGNDDDMVGFFIFIMLISIGGGISNIGYGTDNNFSLFLNTVLWCIFIIPCLVIKILELRTKIRAKRGKQ